MHNRSELRIGEELTVPVTLADVALHLEHFDVPPSRVPRPVRYLNRLRALLLQAPCNAQRQSVAPASLQSVLKRRRKWRRKNLKKLFNQLSRTQEILLVLLLFVPILVSLLKEDLVPLVHKRQGSWNEDPEEQEIRIKKGWRKWRSFPGPSKKSSGSGGSRKGTERLARWFSTWFIHWFILIYRLFSYKICLFI